MKLLIDFILISGVVICSLILLNIVKSKRSEWYSSLLLFFFSFIILVILHSYANLHNLEFLYNATFLFDFTIIWFLGPLLLFYVQSLFGQFRLLQKRNLILLLPGFILLLVIGIPLWLTLVSSFSGFAYISYLEENQLAIVLVRNFYFTTLIIYAIIKFSIYSKAIEDNYSGLSKFDIMWVKRLLFGCLVFISLDTITLLIDLANISISFDTGYLTIISIILITSYLGYFGINQSKILLPSYRLNFISQKDESDNQIQDYKVLEEKLKKMMATQQPYLDEELSLNELADELGISAKQLSTLLNKYMNTSFYDYINSFRVQAVILAMSSNTSKKYTLLAIGMDCGFNSKASFYRIFKKQTGYSPSKYKRDKLRR